MKNPLKKRKILIIAPLILLLAVTALAAWNKIALAAWLSPPVEAPGKDKVGVDDDENVNRMVQKANVLFYLDTSHPMMFEPRGALPYVVPVGATVTNGITGNINFANGIDDAKTRQLYGYGKATAIEMAKYATFGVGTVPPADSFFTSATANMNNYGRDTDDRNNLGNNNGSLVIGDWSTENRYYSPYNAAGHTLSDTFKNAANSYKTAVSGNPALPYMLVFRDPRYWKTGWTGGGRPTVNDLVPNDSRMYQVKLVMWKLLEDRMLFENIRFGMSTVYTCAFTVNNGPTSSAPVSNTNRNNSGHYVYKIPPYSVTATYPYGQYFIANDVGNTMSTGTLDLANGMQSGTWGVTSSNADYRGRSFLRVPIAAYDKVWETKGKKVSMTQLERFRQWLDGVEDVAGQVYIGNDATTLNHDLNANQFDIHKDPELKVSSSTPVAAAIFPNPASNGEGNRNRSWYLSNKGIAYAKKDSVFHDTSVGGNTYNFYFKPGSGQAVGSVLDFFSPHYGTFGSSNGVANLGVTNGAANTSEKFSDMIDEQFPIRNACDPNYVVMLTAGDNTRPGYTTETAIKNLYDHTKNNAVTMMYYENGQRKFREEKLDKPIKTIVVGFVDPNDNSANGVKLRDTLTKMARAGMGYDVNDASSPAKAYLAHDVPSLLAALREIMIIINADVQPSKGSMLEGKSLPADNFDGMNADDSKSNLYAGAFRINMYDQWEGQLTKYVAAKDPNTGKTVTNKGAELGEMIRGKRDTATGTARPRALQYWAGGSDGKLTDVPFNRTEINTFSSGQDEHPLAKLIGLGKDDIDPLLDLSAAPMAGKTHLSRAMFNWYFGYDASYIDGKYYPRRFMLADQGKSGIVMMGVPSKISLNLSSMLEGANAYADQLEASKIPSRLFVQTNDGMLHAVNPATMAEENAILPPPTMLPRRIFSLKSELQPSGKYKWVDVKDFNVNTSDDIPISSKPAYILDGQLQLRHFNLGSNTPPYDSWKSLLFGALGRGGSGMYSMDVTNPGAPLFYWYRETIEKPDGSVDLLWRAQGDSPPAGAVHNAVPSRANIARNAAYWADVYSKPGNHAYEQLGYNSPKAYFSVAEIADGKNQYKNLIALAGGVQRSLDLSENGRMGAAIYLIDPDAKYHKEQNPSGGVRVFNSGSLSSVATTWRVGAALSGPAPFMGMVTSEPVFLASSGNAYKARGMFFADNRGSVFYSNFIVPDTEIPYDSWDKWELRAVASLRLTGDADADSYSIPGGVTGGSRPSSPQRLWVAGGTANVARADPPDQDLQVIRNKSQMIFAFVMPDLKTSGGGKITTRSEWKKLDPNSGGSKIDDGGKGWYIPLQDLNNEFKDEYVTTRPVLFNGTLYAATFREDKINPAMKGKCESSAINGTSRLYAVDLESGMSLQWNDGKDKYLEFHGMKMNGFTMSETGGVPTLMVTYQVFDKDKSDGDINKNTGKEESLNKVDGMDALSITMPKPAGGGRSNVKNNDGIVNYWRFLPDIND